MSKKIVLREVNIKDREIIFKWRNDRESRKQSFTTQPISYSQHLRWFKKTLHDPSCSFYIGINEKGEKCGVVRFNMKNDSVAEINVVVSPGERRKGIGREIICKGVNLFFKKRKTKLVIARIKEKNIASLKAFSITGFFEMFQYEDRNAGRINVLGCLNPYE